MRKEKKQVTIATERVLTKTLFEGGVYSSPNIYGDGELVSRIDFSGLYRGFSLDIISMGDTEVTNKAGRKLSSKEKVKLFSNIDDFYMAMSTLNQCHVEGTPNPRSLKKLLNYEYDTSYDAYYIIKVYYCGTHIDLCDSGVLEGMKFKHLFTHLDIISEELIAFDYTRGIRNGLLDTSSEAFKEFAIVLDYILLEYDRERIIMIEEDFTSKFDEFIANFRKEWVL